MCPTSLYSIGFSCRFGFLLVVVRLTLIASVAQLVVYPIDQKGPVSYYVEGFLDLKVLYIEADTVFLSDNISHRIYAKNDKYTGCNLRT
jgi:hypothetical protein